MPDTPALEMSISKVADLPDLEPRVGDGGKWTAMIAEANTDGETRRLAFNALLTKTQADTIRRQLSHTANAIGRGLRSRGKVEGSKDPSKPVDDKANPGVTVVYFKVVDKRPKAAASSSETAAAVAAAPAA